MTRILLIAAIALLPAAQAPAQDFSLTPTFGDISLQSGFVPDPNWIRLLAGGDIQSEYPDANTGGRCVGYFADAPDLRVHYQTGDTFPLNFFVDSGDDTVLLINTPDGAWHCNDDTSGLNPALSFEQPLEGQYDIWVGTYNPILDDYPTATLNITELEAFSGQFERAFFGEDDRVVLDPTEAPWTMIGFVDLSAASCTGTLIGPATVLTSAHCIANNGQIENQPVEFLAGFTQGNAVARSAITGYHLPQGWLAGEQEGTDYAFLFLAEPIGNQVGFMDFGALSALERSALEGGTGPDILQAGYSFDQDGVLTGNLACPFVEVTDDNLLIHECDTLQGDSGSPLFIEDGAGYRIVGVESRTDAQPDQPYDRNVAVYAEDIAAEFETLTPGATTQVPVTVTK
ncbi:trypsin-like serine protease [Gymnodinialimonas sp. 2305UL16-5]|uniref:trypsin-like serine peptidase n=1 Tax=Gymnodinialimonas mytili TaxID=3126503 RepID=UPI00309590CF